MPEEQDVHADHDHHQGDHVTNDDSLSSHCLVLLATRQWSNSGAGRSVFEAGIWQVGQDKWDAILEAFHGFNPAQIAGLTSAEIAAIENDARVIRNKSKIRATVGNAREVLAILDSYGSIHAYFASFPDAHAASRDLQRGFKFIGEAGVQRLLSSAARDIGG